MEDALRVGVICKMNDLDKHGVKEAETISSKAEKKLLKIWNILYSKYSEIFYTVITVYTPFDIKSDFMPSYLIWNSRMDILERILRTVLSKIINTWA